MNVYAPISTIMSTDLKTLFPDDPVQKAKDLFDAHNIHHVPVVGFKEVIGIMSKTDLMHFLRGTVRGKGDEILEATRLRAWKVKEIMNEDPITLNQEDSIMQALEVFEKNQVHCIPIMDGETLVGILTPHDIILKVKENALTK